MCTSSDNPIEDKLSEIEDADKNEMIKKMETWLLANRIVENAVCLKNHVEELEKATNDRCSELMLLHEKIKKVEDELHQLYEHDANTIDQMRRRIDRTGELLEEYGQLADTRDDLYELAKRLNADLKGYGYLLKIEQTRIRSILTSSRNEATDTSESSSKPVSMKRKYHDDAAEPVQSEYNVTITRSDPWGEYIKLENTGVEEISIGDWFLRCEAVTDSIVYVYSYRFHKHRTLKSGASIVVYSVNAVTDTASDKVKDEQTMRVMMKKYSWPTGNSVKVTVIDNNNKNVAFLEIVFQRPSVVQISPPSESPTAT